MSVTTPESNNGEVVIALNAGGNSYKSASGIQFINDASSGFVSGGQVYSTTAAIANTQDTVLYQSERYGNFNYSIPLPNGSYNVLLKFAEIYQDNPGARIFSVYIEGKEVIHNLDLYFRTGKYTAYDVVIPVELNDDTVNINFVSVIDNAKLSAMEICKRNATVIHDIGSTDVPKDFSLEQNFPNPFNPSTTIEFSLPVRSEIQLTLINMLGQVIKEIKSGDYIAGVHRIILDASNFATGVYFYKLTAVPLTRRDFMSATGQDGQASIFVEVKKLVFIK